MSQASPEELRDQVLRAYLQRNFQRPGRIRLMPEGYEEYGPSLISLASSTQPLIFETNLEGTEYGIAETCFLARYRGRLFAITANHCLSAQNGNDVRISIYQGSKSFLPLKEIHRAKSDPPNQDHTDFAIFEAQPELLNADERQRIQALELDAMRVAKMSQAVKVKLVVPGFPKCLNEVNYERLVIHTQRYLPSGKYQGDAGRFGIYSMEFDEIDQIDHPDGMSGSPVLVVEEHPEAHFVGFLGVMIKASKLLKTAEFISGSLIFQMLDHITGASPQRQSRQK